MPTISKVRWPSMGQDYGWLFDIQNYDDLEAYWGNVRKTKNQNLFHEALKYAQGKAHANVLATLAEMKGISLYDALSKLNLDIATGMSSALDEFGRIFINDRGGYFAFVTGIVIDETKEINLWALPGKEPRFIQWDGGSHWYAKIGDEDIVVDGKQKWDTKAEAQAAAKKYLTGKNRG